MMSSNLTSTLYIHARKLLLRISYFLEFHKLSLHPKVGADMTEFFISSYRHLNFVIKSPVRHAFGNENQGLCVN